MNALLGVCFASTDRQNQSFLFLISSIVLILFDGEFKGCGLALFQCLIIQRLSVSHQILFDFNRFKVTIVSFFELFLKIYFIELSSSIRIKDWRTKTNANISQSLSIHLDDSYFWFFMFCRTNTRYRNPSPANNCLYNAGHIFRPTCSTLQLLCRVSTVRFH